MLDNESRPGMQKALQCLDNGLTVVFDLSVLEAIPRSACFQKDITCP